MQPKVHEQALPMRLCDRRAPSPALDLQAHHLHRTQRCARRCRCRHTPSRLHIVRQPRAASMQNFRHFFQPTALLFQNCGCRQQHHGPCWLDGAPLANPLRRVRKSQLSFRVSPPKNYFFFAAALAAAGFAADFVAAVLAAPLVAVFAGLRTPFSSALSR